MFGGPEKRASLYLRWIKMPAPCCTLAMASCLCSLSNRKWPPLCCCCRLKAHRLTRRPKPPFWSQRTESRQQQRERRKGGTQGRGESLHGGCYGEGAMGKDGREGERIKTWGSFFRQAIESPLVSATRVRQARTEGLAVASERQPRSWN